MSLLFNTREALNARKGHWPEIAKATGISYSWLCKFGQGQYRNPAISYVERLSVYFESHPVSPAGRRA